MYGDGISTTTSTVSADSETGICTVYVKNSSGYELPETGGMGITLHYIFGAMLCAGAVICSYKLRRRRERRAE